VGSVAAPNDPRLRLANSDDSKAIAVLHADSWRRHYRGAYSDAYLDGDVISDRLVVWANRLHAPAPRSHTVVAENDDHLIGFAHTEFEADPTWGALLDNLHVSHGAARRGIGSRLLASAASAVLERRTGLYLWVLEQNRAAQAFYEACGGTFVDRAPVPPPGGIVRRLTDSPTMLRYVWSLEQLPVSTG
jgi:ribosomal protein S18 acetylase RimI-like enzyme